MAETKETKNKDIVVSKVVRSVLAGARTSGAKTKKRGEISGGGKKPWRQKGTGRARVGSNRSPIWRGGGIVFGPTGNENHTLTVNRKEKLAARATALEAKKAETKNLDLPKLAKTKEAAEFLTKNELTGKVLVLVNTDSKSAELINLKRVFRNIPTVKVAQKDNINVLDVLAAEKIAVLSPKKAAAKGEVK